METNKRKQIKREKQTLLILLSNLYGDHKPLDDDHEPGQKEACNLCTQIKMCRAKIDELDGLLSVYRKSEKEKSNPTKPIKRKPKLYHIWTTNHKEYFFRETNLEQVLVELRKKGMFIARYTILTDEEKTRLLEVDKDTVTTLKILETEGRTGLLAYQGISQSIQKGECEPTVSICYMEYTEQRLKGVIEFCQPFEVVPSKKKGKLQITTRTGSFSVEPTDYLVRIGTRLSGYSKEEFQLTFTPIVKNNSWIATEE